VKEDVIVIVGPTAVGKTALGIHLAKQLNTDVISCDSMQIYKGMDIGTGKVTEEEAEGVKHWMIDLIEPSQSYSVAQFQSAVRQAIKHIHAKGKIPILVGGSGLYVQAILYDYHFNETKRNEQLTRQLEEKAEEKGKEALYDELKEVDPEQADKIHPNNLRRVIRALESYYETGVKMSERGGADEKEALYNHFIIGLHMERKALYEQINARVDGMVNQGLLEEVNRLYHMYGKDLQAMRGIGYKELIPYLEGDLSLEAAINDLKQNSRRFAKRQYTWFKNKMPVHWYELNQDNMQSIYDHIYQDLLTSLHIK